MNALLLLSATSKTQTESLPRASILQMYVGQVL